MLPLFWQKVFNRKKSSLILEKASFLPTRLSLLCLWSCLAFNFHVNAQTPGVLETVQGLIEIQQDQFTKLTESVSNNPRVLNKLQEQTQVKLDPYFSRSLIFHSEGKYLDLLDQNECSLYALLENGLLKHARGTVNNVYVTIEEEGVKETAMVALNNFLQIIYRKKCFANRDLSKLFENQTIKTTIENTNFVTPKTEDACYVTLDEWKQNAYTPYLCKISEAIKRGAQARGQIQSVDQSQLSLRRELNRAIDQQEFYQREIPHFQRTFIQNLCEHLDSPERFCSVYLASDVWNKIINGEEPPYKMTYRCRNLLGKKDLSIQDLQGCAARLNGEPDLCRTRGFDQQPAYYPSFRCPTISDALKVSKLKTDHHDCPGSVENEGIVNINRLIQHFAPKKNSDSPLGCASDANLNFAKLNIEYKNEEAWPMRVCYNDRVTDKEICLPYVPGHQPTDPLGENHVVAQVLIKNNGVRPKTECQIVDASAFNPMLLEYRSGCFIVKDLNQCTNLNCPKRIIMDEKEVTNIRFKGLPLFDYFPNSFRNEKFAVTNILKDTLKLESRTIRNLTELRNFIGNIETGIIHGVGCAEDIIPERFQRQSLNECRPLPFLIDGILEREGLTQLVMRTSIEDLHSPRLMNWNLIYNSVMNYKETHLLDAWTLYGLRR